MSESSSSSDGEFFEDDDMLFESYKCLKCDYQDNDHSILSEHMKEYHNFDLKLIIKKANISDEYQWIKLINFLRYNKDATSNDIENLLWDNEKFLKPQLDDDNLLFLDYKEYKCDDLEKMHLENTVTDLKEEIKIRDNTINGLRKNLENALENRSVQDIIFQKNENNESFKKEEDDRAYFSGYSHYSIHDIMIKDTIRTESYRRFIEDIGADFFKNKIILDVGCGTGILSMFAARAGAKHVYAVDCADILYNAMEIVKINGFEDKITLIRGKVENITLPVNKVDVVISEWMGYMLIYESMLESVLFASRKFDADYVFPQHFSMRVVGASMSNYRSTHYDCWKNVFGFNMKCMQSSVTREVIVGTVPEDELVTDDIELREYNVQKMTKAVNDYGNPQIVEENFELVAQKADKLGALVLYFDTDFCTTSSDNGTVRFSTGPKADSTHWEQSILLFDETIDVIPGQTIPCKIKIKPHSEGKRGLHISLVVNDTIHQKFDFC